MLVTTHKTARRHSPEDHKTKTKGIAWDKFPHKKSFEAEPAGSSKMLVTTHKTARRHNPEDHKTKTKEIAWDKFPYKESFEAKQWRLCETRWNVTLSTQHVRCKVVEFGHVLSNKRYRCLT